MGQERVSGSDQCPGRGRMAAGGCFPRAPWKGRLSWGLRTHACENGEVDGRRGGGREAGRMDGRRGGEWEAGRRAGGGREVGR